jgi:hypothetical protein
MTWRKLGTEPLFFFTGTKRHLGFYPASDAIAHFQTELASWPDWQKRRPLHWQPSSGENKRGVHYVCTPRLVTLVLP